LFVKIETRKIIEMSRAWRTDYREILFTRYFSSWDIINFIPGKIAQLHCLLMELLAWTHLAALTPYLRGFFAVFFGLIGKEFTMHRTNEDMKCEITFACH
jgi:hypothetical protein